MLGLLVLIFAFAEPFSFAPLGIVAPKYCNQALTDELGATYGLVSFADHKPDDSASKEPVKSTPSEPIPLKILKPEECQSEGGDVQTDLQTPKVEFSGHRVLQQHKSISTIPKRASVSANTSTFLYASRAPMHLTEESIANSFRLQKLRYLSCLQRKIVNAIKYGEDEGFNRVIKALPKDELLYFLQSQFYEEYGDHQIWTSLLHLCIKYDNYLVLEYLLSSNVSPSLFDELGRSALALACDLGKVSFAQMLISYGATVTEREILTAVFMGSIDILEFFEAFNIPIFAVCGPKALEIAEQRKNATMIEYLQKLSKSNSLQQ